MSDILPKHAHHAYTHARPWDRFKGKAVGRKEVKLSEVFRPGQKKNPVLDGPDDLPTSQAFGAHMLSSGQGPPRLSAIERSRRNFGGQGVVDEHERRFGAVNAQHNAADVLGPVDLNKEVGRSTTRRSQTQRQEEDAVDTLRWNPSSGQRNSLATKARRQAQAMLEEEQQQQQQQPSVSGNGGPVSAARQSALVQRTKAAEVRDTLREQPRVLNERGRRNEELRQVRAMLAEEKEREAKMGAMAARQMEQMQAALGTDGLSTALSGGVAALGVAPTGTSARALLANPQRVAALSDPRVQKALQQSLNAPNTMAQEQYKVRNTTQGQSAERKF